MSSETLSLSSREIDSLRLDESNLKIHTEVQIEQLMASIREFGFNDPVGVDERDFVLEGHGRIEAARRLGMLSVPVIVVTGLSDIEKRAYAIAHNQTGMNTGMDREAVRNEFTDLGMSESDYLGAGYSADDVLFLSDTFDQRPAQSAEGGADHNGHSAVNTHATLDRVHRSVLTFDNDRQFNQFQTFVMMLRAHYPEGRSIADRLVSFVGDYEGEID